MRNFTTFIRPVQFSLCLQPVACNLKPFLLCLLLFTSAFSQELTSSQIEQRVSEKTGMSVPEVQRKAQELGINLSDPAQVRRFALQMGVSESELTMLQSAQSAQPVQDIPWKDTISNLTDETPVKGPDLTTRSKYFGYDLFGSVPEAFKPNAVGPVDPGYVVGPGDLLRLAVWGEAEFQYELPVAREGKVLIPKVGQVFVTGTPFEELQKNVKNLLSRFYSGLAKSPPTIFMDLTVAQMKPLRVFVLGEVNKPGGYTISGYASVFNALYSVGGPLTSGSLRNIQVLRGKTVASEIDLYEYLISGKSDKDIRLQNGDVVFIPPRSKTVTIEGEVLRPLIYELREGEGLQELLKYAGGLKSTAYAENAQVVRFIPIDQRKPNRPIVEYMNVSLKECLSRCIVPLADLDRVVIHSAAQDTLDFVSIKGFVKYPGRFDPTGLTLRDLIFDYGGLADSVFYNRVYAKRADLVRYTKEKPAKIIKSFDLEKVRAGSYNEKLLPGDEVYVYSREMSRELRPRIIVQGEVVKPDTFDLNVNMTALDAVLRAGGFTKRSYRKMADVVRLLGTPSGDTLRTVFRLDLPDGIDSPSRPDEMLLQNRDVVIVRPDPDYREHEFVVISGFMKYQGKYGLRRENERLADVLRRAGGPTEEAYLEGARMTRHGKPVVVNFKQAIKNKRDDNVILQDGDSIYVPRKPNTVYVHGEVNNQGYLAFIGGNEVWDYVLRAGGLSDSAQHIFLRKPNGESRKLGTGFFSSNPDVPDGAEIFVSKRQPDPPKDKGHIGDTIKDMFAIATSAVTLIILVTQLL